ncbi:MAG TPA: LuxR C-terminal-related transcriptional regulator [Mycobacteriales bacterium]|nr:LuxR C-terminal-related transcriptional regulator [Mycobacteriales bacterium]
MGARTAARPVRRSAKTADNIAQLVEAAPYAAVLIDIETATILAASDAARALVGGSAELVGLRWPELLTNAFPAGLDLIESGRLTGYEAMRKLKQEGRKPRPVQMWVRAVETESPVKRAIVLLATEGQLRVDAASSPHDAGNTQVIGAVDPDLVIDRISADIEQLTGRPPEAVLHQPLLRLVVDADAGVLLVALGQVASTGRGASASVRVRTADRRDACVCECVLVPLQPPPSVAFALLTSRSGTVTTDPTTAMDELIARFRSGVVGAETSRDLRRSCTRGADLGSLSTRELAIVNRLLDGDRVPTIARDMFVSQSTVRSHLSSLFRKFRVSSQQELITLLRARKGRNVQRD